MKVFPAPYGQSPSIGGKRDGADPAQVTFEWRDGFASRSYIPNARLSLPTSGRKAVKDYSVTPNRPLTPGRRAAGPNRRLAGASAQFNGRVPFLARRFPQVLANIARESRSS
jgi:hypothetical protein